MVDGSEHIKILVLALLDHMYEYSIFSAIHLTIEILGLFLFLLVHKGQRKAHEQVQNNSKDSPNPSSFSFIFLPSETTGKPIWRQRESWLIIQSLYQSS